MTLKIENRPPCIHCEKRPRAIAYRRSSGTIQYRTLCERCYKLHKTNKLRPKEPEWSKHGYKKKNTCDLCKFVGPYSSQYKVYYIDGNNKNNQLHNLRTICLNCSEIVKRRHDTWTVTDIEANR